MVCVTRWAGGAMTTRITETGGGNLGMRVRFRKLEENRINVVTLLVRTLLMRELSSEVNVDVFIVEDGPVASVRVTFALGGYKFSRILHGREVDLVLNKDSYRDHIVYDFLHNLMAKRFRRAPEVKREDHGERGRVIVKDVEERQFESLMNLMSQAHAVNDTDTLDALGQALASAMQMDGIDRFMLDQMLARP